MIKEPFNLIKNTFLKLTSKTYPYGYEDDLVTEMVECGVFPKLNKDDHGNYFLKIGQSRTIFASHLDTACKAQVNVNHVFDKNIIRTDKTSILGADDKAVSLLCYG
jgi:Cft2 family RNA processing exonuclease